MSGAWSITLFVVSLIVAIMLHEAGHYLTARRFGMRADRFFLGFGPTLWSWRRGETEFGVKALPLGGFVRIVGMSPEDERLPAVVDAVFPSTQPRGEHDLEILAAELERRGTPADVAERVFRRVRAGLEKDTDVAGARSLLNEVLVTEVPDTGRVGDLHHRLRRGDEGRFFHERPSWQRAIVLVAGSLTHFLIAFAVLFVGYVTVGHWAGGFAPEVAIVDEGSPADRAGLVPGDVVVEVAGLRSGDYEALREQIRARPGVETTLVVLRDGAEEVLTVVPEAVPDPRTGEEVGLVGFAPEFEIERLDPLSAVEHALLGEPSLGNPGGFVPMFTGSMAALVDVFSPSGIGGILAQATGQQERSPQGAVSLVGAASIAGQIGEGAVGLIVFLGLIAVVNVFIGIFNLAPLPPLDGGHLAALAIEWAVNLVRRVRGRIPDYRVDPRAIAAVAIPVLALLAVVVLALLWMDITDPIRIG